MKKFDRVNFKQFFSYCVKFDWLKGLKYCILEEIEVRFKLFKCSTNQSCFNCKEQKLRTKFQFETLSNISRAT